MNSKDKNSKKPFAKQLSEIYEKGKRWIAYGSIISILIISYFGNIFGVWRDELLITFASIILVLLFDLLISISKNIKVKPTKQFSSISTALPVIEEIVGQYENISVKILAATGGTTFASILPSIIDKSKARKIEISMGILDPSSISEYTPSHWHSEIRTTIKRLREFVNHRVHIDLFLFEALPAPHGLVINNKHLFIGFFNWRKIGEDFQLSGAQLAHNYYHIGEPEFDYYFNLFESWFNYSPHRKINKMFVFDFDGTLVDSYSCLPDVYKVIASFINLPSDRINDFVQRMIEKEDEQDALRNFNRDEWWPSVFNQFNINMSKDGLIQLIELYWLERTKRSKIIGNCKDTLYWFRRRGIMAIVCGSDGEYGDKKERIRLSGLEKFFDDIIIVGKDIQSWKEGVRLLKDKYDIEEDKIIVFDDKPFPINEISNDMNAIKTVKIRFEGILKAAWSEKCNPTWQFKTIDEFRRRGILID